MTSPIHAPHCPVASLRRGHGRARCWRSGELDPEVPLRADAARSWSRRCSISPASAASDYLIDLGCGDGRIAVAAAQRGARALGVDIDPRADAAGGGRRADRGRRRGGCRSAARICSQTPIHEASVIALYLLPAINLRLRPRLLTELPAGARVVSHAFDMGDWAPDATEEHDGRRIFLWHVPAVAGGSWEVTARRTAATAARAGAALPGSDRDDQRRRQRACRCPGRLRGTALTLASADGAVRLDGRIEGDRDRAGRCGLAAVRRGSAVTLSRSTLHRRELAGFAARPRWRRGRRGPAAGAGRRRRADAAARTSGWPRN